MRPYPLTTAGGQPVRPVARLHHFVFAVISAISTIPQRIAHGQGKLAAAVIRHDDGATSNGARPTAVADHQRQTVTIRVTGIVCAVLYCLSRNCNTIKNN